MKKVMVKLQTPNQDVVFEVSKVTKVKLSKGAPFYYLDQMKDGSWRLVYTEGVLHEFESK